MSGQVHLAAHLRHARIIDSTAGCRQVQRRVRRFFELARLGHAARLKTLRSQHLGPRLPTGPIPADSGSTGGRNPPCRLTRQRVRARTTHLQRPHHRRRGQQHGASPRCRDSHVNAQARGEVLTSTGARRRPSRHGPRKPSGPVRLTSSAALGTAANPPPGAV
jgi:hypothetical protein